MSTVLNKNPKQCNYITGSIIEQENMDKLKTSKGQIYYCLENYVQEHVNSSISQPIHLETSSKHHFR